MTQIGRFSRSGEGYSGTIRTLSIDTRVKLVQTRGAADENAPDYRLVTGSGAELGAGWKRTGDKAGDYVAVVLDDPGFAQPVRANLIRSAANEKAFVLLWSRPKPADAKGTSSDTPDLKSRSGGDKERAGRGGQD